METTMVRRSIEFLLLIPLLCIRRNDAFQLPYLTERATSISRQKLSATMPDSDESSIEQRPFPSRFHFLMQSSFFTGSLLTLTPSLAFDGGVGGLGKTKPETGVVLYSDSAPLQNQQGIVSAEINVGGDPVLVEFTTPWPLLPTTSGLEARNLQSSESAFVSILPSTTSAPWNEKLLKQAVLDNIFGSQGKYGAYGTPTDVKFKKVVDDLYLINFTAYTPAMRESERSVYLKVTQPLQGDLVVLVTGTTRARFKQQEPVMRSVADSFVAIAAPKSQRNVK